uniref:Uncharacterized protein n=1 Tax=Ditylenchus dipsaci TaxID=166011 RepID=A0A915D633_9BILA
MRCQRGTKRKTEEITTTTTTKRRVKIPGEKSPQRPLTTKEKERHLEVEKHESAPPTPAPKIISKSKRSSNANDTPSSIDDKERDNSPAVPPKKLREESSHKRTKEIRLQRPEPTNNSQATLISSSNSSSSHSRRSNGQDSNVKHGSVRSEKKKS